MEHSVGKAAGMRGTADLWIAPSLQVFPLSPYRYQVREPVAGIELVLEGAALRALQLCSSFRSLDAHALQVSDALDGQYAPAEVSELLGRLAGAGLLWSSAAVAQRLRGGRVASATTSDDGHAQDVVIRTCNRPAALERLLQSAAARDREHGAHRRYWVVDDSSDPGQWSATRSVTERAGGELDVVYWGKSEQQHLVEKLSHRLPAYADALHWLLSPAFDHESVTPGRSLNHALLLTAGRRLVLLDDDAALEPYLFGSPEPGMRMTSGPPAARSLSVALPDPAQDAVSSVPLDAIAAHREMLGRELGKIFRDQTRGRGDLERGAIEALDAEDLAGLDPRQRVLLSTNAVIGDPGSADSSWVFLLGDDGLFRQMAASPEALKIITTQREFWRGDRSLTIANHRSLMFTTCTGLDNREFLPPAPPAQRNEDRLFGKLVRYLHPGALTVFMHWALPHRPDPARQWDRTLLDRTHRVGINDLLTSIADQMEDLVPMGDGSARIGVLVGRLRAFAGADADRLRDYLAKVQLDKRTSVVRVLNEELSARPDAPDYWVQDVQRMISANSQPVGDTMMLAGQILGQPEAVPEEAEKRLRDLFSSYASALEVWAEVRKHAGSLVSEIRTQST